VYKLKQTISSFKLGLILGVTRNTIYIEAPFSTLGPRADRYSWDWQIVEDKRPHPHIII